MMTSAEREAFARTVMEEVRRWPGVAMRPHPSATTPGDADGVEFRLSGRQIAHMHGDCGVHLSLTRALKTSLVGEGIVEPLPFAPATGWAMFNPLSASDTTRAIWLMRLNYIRLRRQRLTPSAAACSELLQEFEAAMGDVSSSVRGVLHKTQRRAKPRPLPGLEA